MVLKRSDRFVCVLQSMSVEFRMHTTLEACFGNRTSQLFVIGGIGGGIQQNLTTFIKLKTKNYFVRMSPLLAPFYSKFSLYFSDLSGCCENKTTRQSTLWVSLAHGFYRAIQLWELAHEKSLECTNRAFIEAIKVFEAVLPLSIVEQPR